MKISKMEKGTWQIERIQLKREFQEELHKILGWWSHYMIDDKNGGFFGRMDGQGTLFPKADKGIILNSRLLWTYSAAAIETGNSGYREFADRAYQYLLEFFWDEVEGGVFWSVDYQGNYADDQKQIYAQAFAIYALSEYYILTHKREALEMATEIFWLIEKYSLDKKKGGYYNAFARDWTDTDDIRLSEKDANEAKIMNTHLHVLEAYTNFYRVESADFVKKALENIIYIFIDHFYIPENGSMHIYFDEDWQPKSEHISFGHNIEASWLLWEAAEVLKDKRLLKKVLPISIQMAKSVMEQGLDRDGGLLYEANHSGITDFDKHWWPQAEAVIGFWNAWQLSGEVAFAEASVNNWNFIKTFMIDPKIGEWHWRTNRDGVPILSEDKAGPWKAPYHNVRMCLELINRLS